MVMIVSTMSVSAFADTNNLSVDSTLTVNNLDAGDTVYYYQILEWDTVNNTGWKFTTQFEDLADLAVADILATGEAAPTDTRINSVLKYITGVNAGYTIDANGNVTADATKPKIEGKINSKLAGIIAQMAETPKVAAGEKINSTTWTASTPNVADAGLYMVLVAAGNSGVVYNPIFVSSDYYNADGDPAANGTDTWDVVALATDRSNASLANTYSDQAMAKKTMLTVDKTTQDTTDAWVDGELTDLNKDSANNYSNDAASTSKVGDVVDFTVKTTIPLYSSNYFTDSTGAAKDLTFNVYDTLSTGLELVEGSVSVKTGATIGSEAVLAAGWKIQPNCVPNPARLRENPVKLRETAVCGKAAISPSY